MAISQESPRQRVPASSLRASLVVLDMPMFLIGSRISKCDLIIQSGGHIPAFCRTLLVPVLTLSITGLHREFTVSQAKRQKKLISMVFLGPESNPCSVKGMNA
jgi:hypothetical protein